MKPAKKTTAPPSRHQRSAGYIRSSNGAPGRPASVNAVVRGSGSGRKTPPVPTTNPSTPDSRTTPWKRESMAFPRSSPRTNTSPSCMRVRNGIVALESWAYWSWLR
ncbi:hypothetical protein AMES_2809 [Amycolatopsis mediterranei S699]|uniref:Uncharacterized protein n=1 Tax=Amycolatopsis mediterranei (strain U-32) TaxID=749927 RepID=A0A0H3D366_AMYMU|nr:hypothetical protein AMED_2838 [Amycolatopsis mediterranei U32]AFO76345.1 hypothetical protein AMES_2809 [Amycolatopsis mediterranei S699]AGT83474.1 hypothetical protein B737_2810 [Amycolatopsis mediterranei RB]